MSPRKRKSTSKLPQPKVKRSDTANLQIKGRHKKKCQVSKNKLKSQRQTRTQTLYKSKSAEIGGVSKTSSLRERMMKRLEAAKFRLVNEELDSAIADVDPRNAFASDISNFREYHTAYRERISHWPEDPLEAMINYVKTKVPVNHVIADFGCGEARLSASIPHQTHSFDLFALNERVTECDMSSTPLDDGTVDVAIFCLSLMGTEVGKYIAEAHRILKTKGVLKIAEVLSRFPNSTPDAFVKRMKKFGFVSNSNSIMKSKTKRRNSEKLSSNQVFILLEFVKLRAISVCKGNLPKINLDPCTYKKR